jgi:hypothetical protein
MSMLGRLRRTDRRLSSGPALSAKTVFLALALCLPLLASCGHAPKPVEPVRQDDTYDYPFDNPWAATVIGTPDALKAKFLSPAEPVQRRLEVFPERERPEGFWYHDGLRYSVLLQDHPAPLVFVIAGTGASDRARYMLSLGKVLHAAGLHVALLPSPTHANFIVSASTTRLPGRANTDAADLHRVMRLIDAQIREDVGVTGYHLTGYSLGAWHAAFTAKLDAEQNTFGFKRVLLINPPLNLYNSIEAIDAMLVRSIPNGIDGLDAFLDEAVAQLSAIYQSTDALDLADEDFLIKTYLRLQPPDDRLAAAIGLAFRLSTANMVFTSDVMTKAGYIFPPNQPFRSTTPLLDYWSVAVRTSLLDYFKDIYAAFYLSQTPGLSRQHLIDQSSLVSIGDWLSSADGVWLLTNRDDVILPPGDLDTLQRLFGARSRIYPSGGHLGNLEHRAVLAFIAGFFTE